MPIKVGLVQESPVFFNKIETISKIERLTKTYSEQGCDLLIFPESFTIIDNGYYLYGLTYYSFTTLTSLGFGDILPVSAPAQSVSLLIAIAGQLYLTILVAILVGKYLIQD